MTKSIFNFTSTDGLNFEGIDWSVEQPKAVIAMIHGHGEHKLRYKHVAEFFCEKNIAFVALDHRGHGKSEGKRGHTPSYDQWMDDIEQFLMQVRRKYNDIPLILYGHSMGGNIATNYVLRKEVNDIKAVIITDPLFRIAFEPPKWKVVVGNMMANMWPSLTQPTGLDPNHISTDSSEVQKYISDPLVHNKMSAKMFVEIFNATDWAMENATKLKIPMLLMHGMADEITSPNGSKEFADKSNELVTLKLWDGMYHEIHNEIDKQMVFDFEFEWLNQFI